MAILSLVGAGPGDPDLITLKAVKTIGLADVILYDALANEALLDYCRPSCIRIFAGKRFGCHYLSQQEINMKIIEYASRYERIVRLKGGDPFVFGRAQEEINAARSIGMQIEVIPGISSCIAAPSSEMIPLTTRGVNESFWVTTGTTRTGDLSPDIYLAAKSSATVILLMAMSKLEEIANIFMTEGKGETPVAIIQEATTPNQKTAFGKIKDMVFTSESMGLGNPAVIVIGDVVNLHPGLITQYLRTNSVGNVVHSSE